MPCLPRWPSWPWAPFCPQSLGSHPPTGTPHLSVLPPHSDAFCHLPSELRANARGRAGLPHLTPLSLGLIQTHEIAQQFALNCPKAFPRCVCLEITGGSQPKVAVGESCVPTYWGMFPRVQRQDYLLLPCPAQHRRCEPDQAGEPSPAASAEATGKGTEGGAANLCLCPGHDLAKEGCSSRSPA